MAHIAYANLDAPDVRPLVDSIVAQRGSVLHLYQMLLHSPPIVDGWLRFLTAIRQKSSLPGALREATIMRIAIVNGAPYEFDQHAPIALSEGVTQTQINALADWEAANCFDDRYRSALALADGMTRDIHVADPVIDIAKRHFTDRELVELVATIAAYNMVSRFLEALKIRSDDPR